jgi:hypothetical protein
MIFNIGIFVYARNVVTKLLFVSEELGDLQKMTNAFANHVKSVYELEMFYGDQTLQHLMEHAVSFNEYLGTFEEIYSLTEEENEKDTEEEEMEINDRETEDQTPA